MVLPSGARSVLSRAGMEDAQIQALSQGRPVAFNLSGAAEGTVVVAQVTPKGRLRIGIYTIQNVGGGLLDFVNFDLQAQAVAKAIGTTEVELMGIEITNPKLRAALETGGFVPTTMPVPEELGGGVFTDVISRVESVK